MQISKSKPKKISILCTFNLLLHTVNALGLGSVGYMLIDQLTTTNKNKRF